MEVIQKQIITCPKFWNKYAYYWIFYHQLYTITGRYYLFVFHVWDIFSTHMVKHWSNSFINYQILYFFFIFIYKIVIFQQSKICNCIICRSSFSFTARILLFKVICSSVSNSLFFLFLLYYTIIPNNLLDLLPHVILCRFRN